jgi:3-(3-hydroxy-phenyl)propionate hydroxylase
MPDLDLVTAKGALRAFTLLHRARPVLVNLGEPGSFDIGPWADRARSIEAGYDGPWELPAIGAVRLPRPCWSGPMGTLPGWEIRRRRGSRAR